MRVVSGSCRGTGAILYLCIGFVPDWVKVYNFGDATTVVPITIWNKYFRTDATLEGFSNDFDNADALADHTQAEGIQPYIGGHLMDTTNQPSVTYGNASVDFVTWDYVDYRYKSGTGPHSRWDAEGETIDMWYTDTAGSYTGHFNDDVVGTYIGPGSTVCIAGNWYIITVLAAGAGSAANAVQLNIAPIAPGGKVLPSAAVSKITGMYGSCGYPVARNGLAPPGFKLEGALGVVNTSGEMFMFEAGQYDN